MIILEVKQVFQIYSFIMNNTWQIQWYFYIIIIMFIVTTLTLGSRPRQGVARWQAKRGTPRMKESVREWTLTLPRELPPWELESRWTPECLKSDHKGQNLMDWKKNYIIKKLLKLRCIKWACMTPLNIWNTSYGQKKGRESNWQFDFWPLKVGNQPDFLAFKWCATYLWKAFDEGYNIFSYLISIRGLHTKLWGPKVAGVLILANFEIPIWESRDKMPFECGPRGEPQSIL